MRMESIRIGCKRVTVERSRDQGDIDGKGKNAVPARGKHGLNESAFPDQPHDPKLYLSGGPFNRGLLCRSGIGENPHL
jgi:hypothetical protein